MNIERFKSDKSGRPVKVGQGDRAYWAFVPNPLPPDLSDFDQDMLRAIAEAHGALGELAGLARALPNPMLLVQPFIRREAVLSSMIEGTQTGVAELYAYETGHATLVEGEAASPESDRREVLNYVRALQFGMERHQTLPISLRLIKEIHGVLMQGVRGGRAYPGEFRKSQNWIGGASINSARYVPPPVPEMGEALDAFEKYLYKPHDYPPLVRLALIHYQFEAIHPFVDGNGRVGRLLISLLMVHWELLPLPMLNLSAFFEKNRQEYYRRLLSVTELGQWKEWVLFFLEGIAEQAREAVKLAESLHELQLEWRGRLTDAGVPVALFQLADSLFNSPLLTIPEAQRVTGVATYNTARAYVHRLVGFGILRAVKNGKGTKIFSAHEILSLIAEDSALLQEE